jgi:hypothetical protein
MSPVLTGRLEGGVAGAFFPRWFAASTSTTMTGRSTRVPAERKPSKAARVTLGASHEVV